MFFPQKKRNYRGGEFFVFILTCFLKSEVSRKVDEVKRDVGEVKFQVSVLLSGWTYLGRGNYKTYDEQFYKTVGSFPECKKLCENKRVQMQSNAWNGLLFNPSTNNCECVKNDRGHDDSSTTYTAWKHFRILTTWLYGSCGVLSVSTTTLYFINKLIVWTM